MQTSKKFLSIGAVGRGRLRRITPSATSRRRRLGLRRFGARRATSRPTSTRRFGATRPATTSGRTRATFGRGAARASSSVSVCSGRLDNCDHHFLTVNLAAVHVLCGFGRFFRSFVFDNRHVSEGEGHSRPARHIHVRDFPVHAENLQNVVAHNVACELCDVNLFGLRRRWRGRAGTFPAGRGTGTALALRGSSTRRSPSTNGRSATNWGSSSRTASSG